MLEFVGGLVAKSISPMFSWVFNVGKGFIYRPKVIIDFEPRDPFVQLHEHRFPRSIQQDILCARLRVRNTTKKAKHSLPNAYVHVAALLVLQVGQWSPVEGFTASDLLWEFEPTNHDGGNQFRPSQDTYVDIGRMTQRFPYVAEDVAPHFTLSMKTKSDLSAHVLRPSAEYVVHLRIGADDLRPIERWVQIRVPTGEPGFLKDEKFRDSIRLLDETSDVVKSLPQQ